MNNKALQQLIDALGTEKKLFSDGYYRIRFVSDEEVEMAFLEPDACGATTVCPQITLKKIDNEWHPVKYINMGTSPTQFVELNEENQFFLEQELAKLCAKFEEVLIQKDR